MRSTCAQKMGPRRRRARSRKIDSIAPYVAPLPTALALAVIGRRYPASAPRELMEQALHLAERFAVGGPIPSRLRRLGPLPGGKGLAGQRGRVVGRGAWSGCRRAGSRSVD